MSLAEAPATPPASQSGHFRTAADWLLALGNVPLQRIVFDPLPGTATEADVIRLDDREDRICELVDGTLVEKAMGFDESAIAIRIAQLLLNFIFPRKLGIVTGEAGMMRILARRVRIPDVAFISFDRLPDRKLPGVPIPDLVPDLAIEVISDSNTAREMEMKLQEYFAAGVRLVWYIYPKTQSVDVYSSPTQLAKLSGSSVLTGGEVLPGFEVQVSQIFQLD